MSKFKKYLLFIISGIGTILGILLAAKAMGNRRKINPKIAIPMHYDPHLSRHWKIFPGVGTKEDAIKFINGIDGICQPVLLPCFPEGY